MAKDVSTRAATAPGPVSQAWAARRQAAVPRGVANATPLFIASGRGARITDADGRTYIDFAGGIGTLNVGHCHPRVVAAIKEQADRFLHTCFQVVMYEGYVAVAERLAALTPGAFPKKTLLLSSGAEAVENAVKIARAYTGRPAVIAFTNAFHGRTLGALALTGKEHPYKTSFGPFAPEIYHAPFPYVYRFPGRPGPEQCARACLAALEGMFHTVVAPERVAAIIVEPVQGEGGFIVPPREFLAGLRALCDRHRLLLIADEIQTGFGRTGRMFACEHFGIVPDVMVVAKSLAAGLPLSAVVGRADVMDAPEAGGLGGTYAGNPVACAAALAVLDVFEEERLVERARHLGERIQAALGAMAGRHALVGEVRALGPMAALELVRDRETREPAPEETGAVLARCREQGLIVIRCGLFNNVVRILVPLVATDDEVTSGLEILDGALRAVGRSVAPTL